MKHSNILAILHFKIMIIVQCKLQFFDSNIILHYGWSALLCRVYLGFYLVNLSNILDFGVGLFHFLFFDKWSWSVSFPPIFSLMWSGTYMLQWFWVASCSKLGHDCWVLFITSGKPGIIFTQHWFNQVTELSFSLQKRAHMFRPYWIVLAIKFEWGLNVLIGTGRWIVLKCSVWCWIFLRFLT